MENKTKTKEDVLVEAEAKIARFLQEMRHNHTLVGSSTILEPYIAYYQPHNYRLYFDFSRENFNPKTTLPEPSKRGMLFQNNTFQEGNKTEIIFKFENCCTIRVKRSLIEIINMLEHKRYYPIEYNDKIYDQVQAINEKKDNECLQILKDFIALFGGSSKLIVKNRYVQEHKVEDEASIKKIPLPMKFYTDVVKKEYNEPNVEFKTSVQAATYLEYRAMERIAPAMKQELTSTKEAIQGILEINASTSKLFNQYVQTVLPIQLEFHKDVKVHNQVLKGIKNSFNKFNRLLLERQKKLGEWL